MVPDGRPRLKSGLVSETNGTSTPHQLVKQSCRGSLFGLELGFLPLRILLMGTNRFGLLTLLAVILTAAIACGSQEVETARAGVVKEKLAKQGLLAVR